MILLSCLFTGCVSLAPANPSASVYASAVLADQPLLYLRLQESSGPTALDQVSGFPLGAYSRQAVFGIAGPFAETRGADQGSIAVGAGGSGAVLTSPVSLVSGFSIEVWIKVSSTSTLVQLGSPEPGSGATLSYNAVSSQLSFIHSDANGVASTVSANYSAHEGQWVSVVATSDAIRGGNLTLYINGAPSATHAIENSPGAISGLQALSGDAPDSISELAVYSSVLSPTQIARHAEAAQAD